MNCIRCEDDKDIEFYPCKSYQNVEFFNLNLCKPCFYNEESLYLQYKSYCTRVERFAELHCPAYLKDQFKISIQFDNINN
jgi:hypothetical protein